MQEFRIRRDVGELQAMIETNIRRRFPAMTESDVRWDTNLSLLNQLLHNPLLNEKRIILPIRREPRRNNSFPPPDNDNVPDPSWLKDTNAYVKVKARNYHRHRHLNNTPAITTSTIVIIIIIIIIIAIIIIIIAIIIIIIIIITNI